MKTREETARQKKAFEYYYGLGDARTLQEVAKLCKMSESTVQKWSAAFNWNDRIKLKDLEIAKDLKKQSHDSVLDIKARLLKMVNVPVEDYLNKIDNGEIPVNIKSSTDIERFIKLILLIYGEPSEIIKGSQSHEVNIYDRINEYKQRFTTINTISDGSDSGDGV